MGDAYCVLRDNLDPTEYELRAFPLESRQLLSLRPEVRLEDGVMVRDDFDKTLLVVPSAIRFRLFELTHAGPLAAHLASERTAAQMRDQYFWRGLRRDVADWCRQCPSCARSKGPPLRAHDQRQKIMVGAQLDLVTMDILSGLPTVTDGSKCMLVLVDAFTKWIEAYPLSDQEASTCMTAAYNGFFSRFGLPSNFTPIKTGILSQPW